jgi:hypothetical protein
MVPTPIQCTRSSTALCATAARGPGPLATLLLVGSPYELGSIYIKTPSPCGFQMPFQQLWICTYDMLAFPVLNQVERLKGADDVFSFDSSHVAQLLRTGKKEKEQPSAKRITFRYSQHYHIPHISVLIATEGTFFVIMFHFCSTKTINQLEKIW